MIRVMHIITRLDMGGSAQNTLDTCLHLDHRRYALYLLHGLSLESGMTKDEAKIVCEKTERAQALGVTVIPIPCLVRKVDPLNDVRAFTNLRRIIQSVKPTIVHTHTSKAGLLGRAAAWAAGVPIIVQTPHGHVFYGHFGPVLSKFFMFIEKLAAVISDRIIALTEQERRDYIRYHVVPPSKLLTIHSGVTLASFMRHTADPATQRKTYGLPETGPLIGFIGWLLPNKGVMHLLNALPAVCRRVPQARLVFVGKGDLEARLRQRSVELGLQSNVVFCGWRNDIHRIMPLMDVFVLPSLNEGMGRVLVEAMAAGRPVVASRTGGIPDLIRHGQNGLLVPPGDESALAAAILKLIQNPAMAEAMGTRGQARCREFGLPAMVEKIDRLYVGLLDAHLRRGRRSLRVARSGGNRLAIKHGQSEAKHPQPGTEPIN